MKRLSHKTHNVRRLVIFFFTLSLLFLASRSQPSAADEVKQGGWRVEITEGKSIRSTLTINNRCSEPHRFRITSSVKYLQFEQPTDSVPIAASSNKQLGVRFNATGLKPKVYKTKVVVKCLDCKKKGSTCTQDRDEVPVEMVVINKANQIVPPPPAPDLIRGRVVDPRNTPVRGAQVSVPGQPVVLTNSKGEFNIRSLAATERLAVSFSAHGFMDTTRIYQAGESSRGINTIVIWPRAAPVSLDATRGGKLTFPGGTVNFPPNALVDERDRPLRGNVRVSFSTLDVSDRRQIRSVPGDFTARMRNKTIRQLETFGVFEVVVEDSEGRRVNLAKGRNATVELSIPQELRRRAPASVGLFSFDQNSGRWIEEGTLKRPPGRTSYVALILNIKPIWNADMPLDTTCITLKILKEDGTPAPVGTKVEAEGVDYSGTSPTGVTNSMGEVCLSVKKCPGTVRVVAYDQNNSAISSCPVRIQTPCQIASAANCGNSTNCPLQPEEIILPGSTPGTFYHDLNADDPANWEPRTGTNYIQGDPDNDFYDVYWLSDSNHIDWVGGIMRLRLDDIPPNPTVQPPQPKYNSAEYRTKATYGYGTYEVCLKAAKGPGLMTSFFTYTGQSETPSTQHNEIDIEFRGQDTTELWTNFYCDDTDHGHESTVTLGFDAADDFHRYKFVWTPTEVKWYVDGQYVPTPNSGSNPCTSPTVPGKIMVNLWSGNSNSSGWLGTFSPAQIPVIAEYDWIRYKP